MLRLPSAWPIWAVWVAFAVMLAGLDLAMSVIGAMLVRTRGTDAQPGWFVAGAGVSLLLFWVLSSSLAYGDMVQMNVLWIAVLLALVPLAQAMLSGELPSPRTVVGVLGMIVFVVVIQWPTAADPPADSAVNRAVVEAVGPTDDRVSR